MTCPLSLCYVSAELLFEDNFPTYNCHFVPLLHCLSFLSCFPTDPKPHSADLYEALLISHINPGCRCSQGLLMKTYTTFTFSFFPFLPARQRAWYARYLLQLPTNQTGVNEVMCFTFLNTLNWIWWEQRDMERMAIFVLSVLWSDRKKTYLYLNKRSHHFIST